MVIEGSEEIRLSDHVDKKARKEAFFPAIRYQSRKADAMALPMGGNPIDLTTYRTRSLSDLG